MSPRLQAATGLVVYVTAVIAIVVLAIAGHDDNITDVITLAGPVVAALLVIGRISTTHAETSSVLAKINEQTNGILDQRIAEGVRATLEQHAPDIYTGVPSPTGDTPDNTVSPSVSPDRDTPPPHAVAGASRRSRQ